MTRLKDCIGRALVVDAEGYRAWAQRASALLRHIFDEDNRHVSDFDKVRRTPPPPAIGTVGHIPPSPPEHARLMPRFIPVMQGALYDLEFKAKEENAHAKLRTGNATATGTVVFIVHGHDTGKVSSHAR